MPSLLPWLPALVTLATLAAAWGALSARDAQRGRQLDEIATLVRTVTEALSLLREAQARAEERHGSVLERVARLEGTDGRHDDELKDARHQARDAATLAQTTGTALSALSARVDRLEERGTGTPARRGGR